MMRTRASAEDSGLLALVRVVGARGHTRPAHDRAVPASLLPCRISSVRMSGTAGAVAPVTSGRPLRFERHLRSQPIRARGHFSGRSTASSTFTQITFPTSAGLPVCWSRATSFIDVWLLSTVSSVVRGGVFGRCERSTRRVFARKQEAVTAHDRAPGLRADEVDERARLVRLAALAAAFADDERLIERLVQARIDRDVVAG